MSLGVAALSLHCVWYARHNFILIGKMYNDMNPPRNGFMCMFGYMAFGDVSVFSAFRSSNAFQNLVCLQRTISNAVFGSNVCIWTQMIPPQTLQKFGGPNAPNATTENVSSQTNPTDIFQVET